MANLGELFSKVPEKRDSGMKHPRRVTQWIHYTKLVRSAFQFYGEITEEIQTLAMLIKAEGEVLQNVIVRKTDVDEYEIIAGHKRVLACKYLVEEGKAEEFAFVPCDVKSMNDIRAQFQVMSSNYHHSKSDYEKMKEVSDMKYLMENYPEEFPDVAAGGRVVEHLAAQLHMKRSTVSEYLAINHNLIPEGKEAFKESKLNKSAACAMAALPEEEQEKLLTEGKTTHKEIKEYREKNLEPSEEEIREFYNIAVSRRFRDLSGQQLKEALIEDMGKSRAGGARENLDYQCDPRRVCINNKWMTWSKFVNQVEKLFPRHVKEIPSTDVKEVSCKCEEAEHQKNETQHTIHISFDFKVNTGECFDKQTESFVKAIEKAMLNQQYDSQTEEIVRKLLCRISAQ